MTREYAKSLLYDIINSGIISEELEEGLMELVATICKDSFELCEEPEVGINYCEGCKFQKTE